jgi:allophanate hydrolase subunit 1
MMGVAPGTVYLGCPTGSFTIPRKPVPRPKPYASSIQVWSTHTTISSFHSPSGWHFIGRPPAASYNPTRPEDPFLVKPGQWVRFREIDADEFEYIEQEFCSNRYEPEIILRQTDDVPKDQTQQ